MQENTLYIKILLRLISFTEGQSFQFCNYSVARRCRRHGDKNFRRRSEKFSQIMNCRRQLLFGLLRVARFEDKKLLVLSQKISEKNYYPIM